MISQRTLRKNHSTHATLKPESLIILPSEKASVNRLTNGRFHIQWQQFPETMHIYANNRPVFNDNARLWASVTGANAVVVPPLPHTQRPYFVLQFTPDDHWITAERFLPVPNSLNFRDIGGYHTENGRFVRWGQVYRSGTLAHLQTADFAFLQGLGIRLIFDLRSSHESAQAPDRLPENGGIQHLLRPLSSAGTRWERIRVFYQYRRRLGDLLLRLYQESFIDDNAHHIGDMLTRLADPANRPALLHCSAGKDRTGITIALLLAVLGVPEDTIVADYTLSNLAYSQIITVMAGEIKQARWAGVSPAHMQPLLLAPAQQLRQTFAYIRSRYGSIEQYLTGAAGVSADSLNTLRQELAA